MKKLRSRLYDLLVVKFLEVFQCIVGSPLFFFVVPVGTIAWMLYERLAPHPIDSPKDYFPLTILVYTLFGLWVENAMKVAQAMQNRAHAAQMKMLERLCREIKEIVQASTAREINIETMVTSIEGRGEE